MHGFVYVMSIINLALQCVWYNKKHLLQPCSGFSVDIFIHGLDGCYRLEAYYVLQACCKLVSIQIRSAANNIVPELHFTYIKTDLCF
jgi:hypothetical protein